MEEGADMIVLGQILDQACVFLSELVNLLSEADACGIDDREVASKGLEEFHGAGLKHLVCVLEAIS
jgi:ERCC4-type nuclease